MKVLFSLGDQWRQETKLLYLQAVKKYRSNNGYLAKVSSAASLDVSFQLQTVYGLVNVSARNCSLFLILDG